VGLLARAKALVIRFVGTGRRGWSLMTYRAKRAELAVGDGSASSIVAAAVGWIARNYPEAPVRVRRKVGTELEEVEGDAGVTAFLDLLEDPNGWYSGVLLWMATIADYWTSGNGYWLKVRSAGRVVALWWIPSWTIEPKWDDREGADFIRDYLYKPTAIDEYSIPAEDVVHFRYGFDPDNPRKGRSPLASVLREILTDDEAAAYTAAILRNLGVPGVVISPDEDVELEDEDADAIKAQFEAEFGGDGRGRAIVLGAKAAVSVLSFNPQQMDLRTIRKVPEERVSGVLGVPAIVAGLGAGLDRSTFANYAEAREAGYEENIIPTHRILDADLRVQLLHDFVADVRAFRVDHDYSEVRVLQEDQNRIWERAGNAVAKGAITLSDFNRLVGLPVDPKLHDVYLRPSQVVAVRVDSPEATGEAEPTPEPTPFGGVPPEGPDASTPPVVPPGTAPVEPAAAARNGNGNGGAPVAV
jgi:HK97 family phage portal protein